MPCIRSAVFFKKKIYWGVVDLQCCNHFPGGSVGEESTCNVGDLGSIPGLGSSPGEGKGYPLQYSGLENSMDCIDHGVTKSWTRLSDFHFTDEDSSVWMRHRTPH